MPLPCNGSPLTPSSPTPRCLTALPVYNEAKHLGDVLDEVARHADDVLVVDDGSTDGSHALLTARNDITLIRHSENRGYGAALKTAFEYALMHDYDVLVTIDCDGQHEPQRIGDLAAAVFAEGESPVDIVSGSRYLDLDPAAAGSAPADRRRVNQTITREINELLSLSITDAFCGFKAYRVGALAKLQLTEPGYAMPLELWVQAARRGLRIKESPTPLIYLDEQRSFGGALDDAERRLAYYREVIRRASAAALPVDALCGGGTCDLSPSAANLESC